MSRSSSNFNFNKLFSSSSFFTSFRSFSFSLKVPLALPVSGIQRPSSKVASWSPRRSFIGPISGPNSFSILFGLRSLLANETSAFRVGIFLGENLFPKKGIALQDVAHDCDRINVFLGLLFHSITVATSLLQFHGHSTVPPTRV